MTTCGGGVGVEAPLTASTRPPPTATSASAPTPRSSRREDAGPPVSGAASGGGRGFTGSGVGAGSGLTGSAGARASGVALRAGGSGTVGLAACWVRVSRSRWSWRRSCSAEPGRASGSLVSICRMKASSAAGSSGTNSEGLGGRASTCFISRSTGEVPVKGSRPVTISKATTPRAYRSVMGPTGWPRACSGAMYSGVPTTMSVRVCAVRPVGRPIFARPKSSSFT